MRNHGRSLIVIGGYLYELTLLAFLLVDSVKLVYSVSAFKLNLIKFIDNELEISLFKL